MLKMLKSVDSYETVAAVLKMRTTMASIRWFLLFLLSGLTSLVFENVATAQQQPGKDDKTANAAAKSPPSGTAYSDSELVDFHATAYCLKRRKASGIDTRPGVIAADPRVLPLGTVVHLRAGRYTGTYTVMDTGGRIKGRLIDVYVPTYREAREFGRRQVKIKVIGQSPSILRTNLEANRSEKRITDEEYEIRNAEIIRIADTVYSAAAKYLIEDGGLLRNADYSPNKLSLGRSKGRDLVDTFYERIQLEIDVTRTIISQAEYEEKRMVIVDEEESIIRERYYASSELSRYYEKVSRLPKELASLEQSIKGRKSASEILAAWAGPIVVFIATVLTFFISYRKDRREIKGLKLQEKEIEFKRVQAQETIEKTSLLLEMRDLQLEEMKLKVSQLERQLFPKQEKLVILQE